jgi:phosphonate transport system substrate-binding protein
MGKRILASKQYPEFPPLPAGKSIIWSTALVGSAVVLLLVILPWLGRGGDGGPQTPPTSGPARVDGPKLRLALAPERNIVVQRRQYRALADYLEAKLGLRVELVTLSTYQGVLDDLASKEIEGGFIGSMVVVMAYDRLGVRVLVKPEYPVAETQPVANSGGGEPYGVTSGGGGGGAFDESVYVASGRSYRGVIFVRDDSPIRDMDGLGGRSLGLVRATTAGQLFAMCLLREREMLRGEKKPDFRMMGTHDQVIHEVAEGRLDAGSAKDQRLDAYEREPGHVKLRRLAVSDPVPNNALVLRGDLDPEFVRRLEKTLLEMEQSADGRQALRDFGVLRFLPCRIQEYGALFDMIERLGPDWSELGIAGPAPRRPAPASAPSPVPIHRDNWGEGRGEGVLPLLPPGEGRGEGVSSSPRLPASPH